MRIECGGAGGAKKMNSNKDRERERSASVLSPWDMDDRNWDTYLNWPYRGFLNY